MVTLITEKAITFCHLLKRKKQQKLEQKVGIDIYRVVEPNRRRSELLLDVYGRTLQWLILFQNELQPNVIKHYNKYGGQPHK
jgi:hypothetical protein